MKFFVDENIPHSITNWLLQSGYDVQTVAESEAGELDAHWVQTAIADSRLIITSDKDFGDLIYRDKLPCYGVVLLRLGQLPVTRGVARLQEVGPSSKPIHHSR